jgi:hypothetical protein
MQSTENNPIDFTDRKKVVQKVEEVAEKNKETPLEQIIGVGETGKYKIEVQFGADRTSSGVAFTGLIIYWMNGSEFSGGGDAIVYPCPDNECTGLIDSNYIAVASETAMCQKCLKVWKMDALCDVHAYKRTPSGWAALVAEKFNNIGGDADLYLKHTKGKNLHKSVQATLEKEGGYVAEALFRSRKKNAVLYKMKQLHKDASNGSTIESRVLAFLQS